MSEVELMHTHDQRCYVSVLVVAVSLAVLMVSGCMVGPDYRPPQPAVPTEWVGVAKTPTCATVSSYCTAG